MMQFRTSIIAAASFITFSILFLVPLLWTSHRNDKSLKTPDRPLNPSDLSTSAEPTTTTTRIVYITRTTTIQRHTTATRKHGQPTPTQVVALATPASNGINEKNKQEKKPVEVEMHVMSKCPDAADCIHDLILPLMANLSDSGEMTLIPSYIGTLDNANGGVICKHGESECLGNMLELCVYNLYQDSPKIWLPFLDCLSSDIESIPQSAFVHECAKEHAVDFEKVNECVSDMGDKGGSELLRASVERSKNFGISTSCTIRVAGKVRCVRDDGEWKNCEGGHTMEELRRDILKLYDAHSDQSSSSQSLEIQDGLVEQDEKVDENGVSGSSSLQ